MFLSDKIGRRPLLVWGSIGMMICLFIVGALIQGKSSFLLRLRILNIIMAYLLILCFMSFLQSSLSNSLCILLPILLYSSLSSLHLHSSSSSLFPLSLCLFLFLPFSSTLLLPPSLSLSFFLPLSLPLYISISLSLSLSLSSPSSLCLYFIFFSVVARHWCHSSQYGQ